MTGPRLGAMMLQATAIPVDRDTLVIVGSVVLHALNSVRSFGRIEATLEAIKERVVRLEKQADENGK